MTDDADLRRAVCAAPEDDAPRLVYADWLDEHGEGRRAEFIRVQIELAREEPQSPRWRSLVVRERKAFDWRWRRDALKGRAVHCEFARGFVDRVTVYPKRFVEDGEAIFAAEPVRGVKFVHFQSARGTVPIEQLADSPHLERIRRLDLEGSAVTGAELDRLIDGRRLRGLRELSLRDAHWVHWEAVLCCLDGSLPDLASLDLSGLEFRDAAVARLPATVQAGRLRALDLSRLPLPVITSFALRRPTWGAMESLDLGSPLAALGPEVARAIGESSHFARLRQLHLGGQGIGDEGAEALARAGHLTNLCRLHLQNNGITDRGVEALLAAPCLRGLYWLNLDGNNIARKAELKKQARAWCPEAVIRMA